MISRNRKRTGKDSKNTKEIKKHVKSDREKYSGQPDVVRVYITLSTGPGLSGCGVGLENHPGIRRAFPPRRFAGRPFPPGRVRANRQKATHGRAANSSLSAQAGRKYLGVTVFLAGVTRVAICGMSTE